MTATTRYSETIHASKTFLHSFSLPESAHLNPLVGPFPTAMFLSPTSAVVSQPS